jgi:L-2-hydroxyglutarate oxidase LhgO
LVVGAGVVGLAVARELSTIGLEVVVVEAETVVGSITSARNSEVIHAGIYYAPGSLKASLCVSGRRMLYEYCERRGVPFRRRGKLIVATTPEQVERLIAIKARAEVNDVDDLRVLDRAETLRLEPELACVAALVSPSTGIVDSHSFMQSLLGEAQDHGAMVALGSRVQRGEVATGGIRVTIVDASGHTTTLVARRLVNAAGLHAPAVAGAIDGLAPEHVPAAYFAKGNYFSVTGRVPFSRLVYPVPSPGGLGVHLTLDLGGQARFGPDVEWLDVRRAEDIHYAVEPRRADRFYAEIRKYWPGLPDTALEPAFSGVRPKLVPAGAVDGDFVIDGPSRHGVPGLVNLFGIESPGLTAALAIAESVGAELGVR